MHMQGSRVTKRRVTHFVEEQRALPLVQHTQSDALPGRGFLLGQDVPLLRECCRARHYLMVALTGHQTPAAPPRPNFQPHVAAR